MKKFPGKVERGGGNHRTVMLNDEQKEWLMKWYPVTENERLAKAMDMSVESMRKQARLLGVYKSEKGMEGIRKRQAKAMLRTCRKKGVYEGRVPSEATIEGNRNLQKEMYRESLGYLERAKEIDPNREKANWAYPLYQCYYLVYSADDPRTKEMEEILKVK
jgi:hypothetical protein